MEFCPRCGLALPIGAAVCPRCGAPAPGDPGRDAAARLYGAPPMALQPPAMEASPAPAPAVTPRYQAAAAPEPGTLGTGGYLLCLVLFNLPIVGCIIALAFALGGTRNPAKCRLARAQLLFWLLCIGLVIVYFVVLAIISFVSMRGGTVAVPRFYS